VARAGKLIYEGFFILWDGFWIVWISNLFWLALCIPIVTIPLAFAGLYTCVHGLVRGESLDWKSFFSGIKLHFVASLRWAGVNLLVFLTLAFYGWYLADNKSDLAQLVSGVPLALGLMWWMVNMYTFPFMLVQEKPSYLTALRNSSVMFVKWPGFAFGFTIFNVVIIAISLWLRFPWLVLSASLPALMACLCVKDIVEQTVNPAS
jgi:hypothetical protein